MSRTIMEALFDYFGNCPLMADGRFIVDFVHDTTQQDGAAYAMSGVLAEESIYPYANGGARCRYPFVIRSVDGFGKSSGQEIVDCGFFEQIAGWMRTQTRMRKLPQLPTGLTPRSIRPVEARYLYQPDIHAGKYQIQCELEFYRKGDS